MPRMKLIEEGYSSNVAFIIKKGTCMLVSSKNPLSSKISHKGHIIVEKNKFTSNKGYISETTSTFQLGSCTAGQWVGEDILVLNDLPFPFSIVAKTEVIALEISKQDIQSKIPYSFRATLEENARDRNIWLQKRIRDITKTSHIIYKQDHKQGVYDKVLNQLLTRHPQANSNALKSFTNHHVSITGMENTGRIIKRVASNQRDNNNLLEISGTDGSITHTDYNESHKRGQMNVVNKASFGISTKHDNASSDAAYTSIAGRGQTAPDLKNQRKTLIEISFEKMKLNKMGKFDQNALLFHKRHFSNINSSTYSQERLNEHH